MFFSLDAKPSPCHRARNDSVEEEKSHTTWFAWEIIFFLKKVPLARKENDSQAAFLEERLVAAS